MLKLFSSNEGKVSTDLLGGVVGVLMILVVVSGWLTHIFTCLSDDRWGVLIAGAILFPIGILHGWGIWLGIF